MEFKAAICPYCGGDLQLPENKQVLKCMYCGKDIVVQEAIGKAQPSLENYLTLARHAKNTKNYNEAFEYYTKVLELDPQHYEAWLGKAESAGWESTIDDIKVQELITNFEKAIECCPAEKKADFTKNAVKLVNTILVSSFNFLSNYSHDCYKGGGPLYMQNIQRYLTGCSRIIFGFERLSKVDPSNIQVISNIIFVSKHQLEAIEFSTTFLNKEYKSDLSLKVNIYTAKGRAINPSFIPPAPKKRGFFPPAELIVNDSSNSFEKTCEVCIHNLSKSCPNPKLNLDSAFRKNKHCDCFC